MRKVLKEVVLPFADSPMVGVTQLLASLCFRSLRVSTALKYPLQVENLYELNLAGATVEQKTIGHILSCPSPLLALCMTLCIGITCIKTKFILQLSHLLCFSRLWEERQSSFSAVLEVMWEPGACWARNRLSNSWYSSGRLQRHLLFLISTFPPSALLWPLLTSLEFIPLAVVSTILL